MSTSFALGPRAWRFGLAGLLAFSSSVRVGLARAEGASPEAIVEARRELAKQKFDDGANAYRDGRYADAIRLFLQSDELSPSPALSFNIARVYERQDDSAGALRWYRDYLRRSPEAKNASEVRRRTAELAARLAESGVQLLGIWSVPTPASVLIDGRDRGSTPLSVELPPGKHHLSLRALGFRDREQEIELGRLEPEDVTLRLEPALVAPADPATTPRRSEVVRRAPSGRRLGVAPWVVAGAGVAGLAGALGFELARRSEESSAAGAATQRDYSDHFERMQSDRTKARVLLGAGALLTVTGGVLLVLDSRSAPVQVGFGFDAGELSLAAHGSFD